MFELTIPEDIEAEDLITEKKSGVMVKFVPWVRANLLTDQRMNNSGAAMASNIAVRSELRREDGEDKEAGDKMRLHPNDKDLLAVIAKCPQYLNAQTGRVSEGYGPNGYQFQRFIEAIDKAEKVQKNGTSKKSPVKAVPAEAAADEAAPDDVS